MANKKKTSRRLTIEQDGRQRYNGGTITEFVRKGGISAYDVYLKPVGQKKIQKRTETIGEAKAFIDQKLSELRSGKSAEEIALSDKQISKAIEAFKRLKPYRIDLLDAIDVAIAHSREVPLEEKVGSLLDSYLQEKKEGNYSASYTRDFKRYLDTNMRDYADGKLMAMSIKVIGEGDIDDWLETEEYKARDAYNHKRYVKGFFKWCVEKRIVSFNPIGKVPVPDSNLPDFYGHDEAEAVMRSAESFASEDRLMRDDNGKPYTGHATEIVAWLGVVFFCGVRTAEMERITWENIDLTFIEDEDGDNHYYGEIRLPYTASKTKKPRAVPITKNAYAWLAPNRKHRGQLFSKSDSKRREWITEIFKNAGVIKIQNGFRKTFATYSVALNGKEKTISYMGHQDGTMLAQFYEGLAERREPVAKRYFNIFPSKEK